MSYINEGDWGGDDLPLVFREHIREVEVTLERLVASIAKLGAVVAGYGVGAEKAAERVGARI